MAAEAAEEPGALGLDLRQHALATSTGPDFDYGLLAIRSTVAEASPWVALVVVGEGEDGEIIVALPGKAWHRTQARRLIPTSCFQLPRAASVRVVAPEDREAPLDGLSVRLWIGRLSSDWSRYAEVEVVGEIDLELGTTFGDTLEAEHTDVEAAGDRISYQTAEEEPDLLQPAASERVGPPPAWATRVEELERGMTVVQKGIQDILGKLGEPGERKTEKPAAPRPSALRSRAAHPTGGTLAGLDPAVVQAARAAGVPESHLPLLQPFLPGPRPSAPGLWTRPRRRTTPRRTLLSQVARPQSRS